MKRSTLGVRRSKLKVARQHMRPGRGVILDPFSRVNFLRITVENVTISVGGVMQSANCL